jgi:menaquinone-dependent protoporphyrinogen oxidase
MKRVLILYGTTDGHTAKIAGVLGSTLTQMGCIAHVIRAGGSLRDISPDSYDAVFVAASVQAGRYQKTVRRWVRLHHELLQARPAAFVSVCLAVLQHQPAVDQRLREMVAAFSTETGWRPEQVKQVAGALPYTRYGWLKKRLMRRIARKAGGGTDIGKDYEYTDWNDLRTFAHTFAETHGLVQSSVSEPAFV